MDGARLPGRIDDEIGPIVYFGNVPFASPWQRSQQLAMCLAGSTDVVYVDPNRSFLQVFRQGLHRRPSSPNKLPKRLRVHRSSLGLPLGRWSGSLNKFNCARTIHSLRTSMEGFGLWPPKALVATFPDQMDALRHFDRVPVIYDLMDEPDLFLRSRQLPRYRALHAELMSRADLLVASSHTLLNRYQSHAARSLYLSNGVRAELVHDIPLADVHAHLGSLPRPRFGYIGMISHWFDFDIVRSLAEKYPDGSVILVGPVEVPIPPLPDNVIFIGTVLHLALAPVLKAFDVGIIPFRRSSAIDAVNPVKLYEYLAAGLPVLSSRFSEIVEFSEFVTLYDSEASCVTQAGKLFSQPATQAEMNRRRAFALKNTWTDKARLLLETIEHIQNVDIHFSHGQKRGFESGPLYPEGVA